MPRQFELNNRAAANGAADLTILILTLNEEKHIRRCLASAFQVASRVLVVDSFSTDQTVEIAESLGAQVSRHEFKNQSAQLAWALEALPIDTNWVMRVDADEVISSSLATEIREKLRAAAPDTNGYLVHRLVCFGGKPIRHGGVSHWVLRIWRKGRAHMEQRWMDEHMVLESGRAARLQGEYFDDNLNNIAWWTSKHNGYSTREAIELLNSKYAFLPLSGIDGVLTGGAGSARWLKENVYVHLPLGVRSVLYFAYRMIFRLGILDGRSGFVFHFLQGFWYRFLVDVKVREVERRMAADNIGCAEAIRLEFGIDPLQ